MVKVFILLRASILVATVYVASSCHLVPGTPEAAFYEFQTTQHKESYIVLPLCTAGEMVVPLVTEKVNNKNLDRRGYAIQFLGATNSSLPIDTHERIAKDESDEVYPRGNAVMSLFLLHERRGRAVAEEFSVRTDFLGETARHLITVPNYEEFRRDYYR